MDSPISSDETVSRFEQAPEEYEHLESARTSSPRIDPPFPHQIKMGKLTGPVLVFGVFWFPFGHILFAGGLGWMIFFDIFALLPAYAVVALTHFLLFRRYSALVGQRAVGPLASRVVPVVYVLIALFPLFVPDTTDAMPIPPAISVMFGLSDAAGDFLLAMVMLLLVVGVAATIITDIVDVVRAHRSPAKTEKRGGTGSGRIKFVSRE